MRISDWSSDVCSSDLLINEYLRHTFRSSLLAGLGYMLARPAMKKLRERVDPRGYNGAMFLGLNGIAVKSHGGTDALGFANAIGVAVDLHRPGIIEQKIGRTTGRERGGTSVED